LRFLSGCWERTLHGEEQMVLIVGEPGIGKSRLVHRFHEKLAGTPHTWIECTGAPFFQNTPFYPVSHMLQQAFAWRGEESLEVRLSALESSLKLAGMNPGEAVPLIAPLLNLSVLDRYPALLITPEQRRQRLLTTLVAWVYGVARVQPLVIVTEDLHWADPSTLELVQLLVQQRGTVPLLLLYTVRPEFCASWPMRAHHSQLTLSPLSAKHVREMVMHVVADRTLSDEVVEALLERTGGVPLFIEELTRAVLESDKSTTVRGIPATLQDSLMARLDRLGRAKEVAQVAAVIGREFSYELLRAVLALPEPDLRLALDELTAAELFYVRGRPPEALYLYKHALVQDAAYEALLKSSRRELHKTIARVLTEQFPDTAEAQPELLARHYTEAGEPKPAVAAWQKAGDRAFGRGALKEAEAYYTKALTLVCTLPDIPDRTRQEFLLEVALGSVLLMTRGYSSTEATEAYARARALGKRLDDPAQLLLVLFGLFVLALTRGEILAAQALADELFAVAERDGRRAARVWAHYAQGVARYYRGDLAGSWEHLRQSDAFYDEKEHRTAPVDPGWGPPSYGSWVSWSLGRADTARALGRNLLALTRRLNKPDGLVFAQYHIGILYAFLREPDRVREQADALIAMATEKRFPLYVALGDILRGWAFSATGQYEEGVSALRHGIAEYSAAGSRLGLGLFLGMLTEAQSGTGALAEALGTLDDAMAACPDEEVFKPGLLRIRGELMVKRSARRPDPQSNDLESAAGELRMAEQSYREAIRLANRIGASSDELRAATSLGRLLKSQGRAIEARELLSPVYARFTEGFDTRDLIEAKIFLEELRH